LEYGISKQLTTNNSPQFFGKKFEQFPNYPQSSGMSEKGD
jgi:hypothetical protein